MLMSEKDPCLFKNYHKNEENCVSNAIVYGDYLSRLKEASVLQLYPFCLFTLNSYIELEIKYSNALNAIINLLKYLSLMPDKK